MSSPRNINEKDLEWIEKLKSQVESRYKEVLEERKKGSFKNFFANTFNVNRSIHKSGAEELGELGVSDKVKTTQEEITTVSMRDSKQMPGSQSVRPVRDLDELATAARKLEKDQKKGQVASSIATKGKLIFGSLAQKKTETKVKTNVSELFMEEVKKLEEQFIKAFNGQEGHGLKRSHGLAKRKGDVEKFIKDINKEKGKHQFLRQCAAALHEIYQNYPETKSPTRMPQIRGTDKNGNEMMVNLSDIVNPKNGPNYGIQPITLDKQSKKEVRITFDNPSPRETVRHSLKT